MKQEQLALMIGETARPTVKKHTVQNK